MSELRLSFVGFLAVAALGCGGGTTEVTGKVSFEGKPVVYGTVTLVGSDGLPKYGKIEPDGTFRIADAKLGPSKVYITSARPPGVPIPGNTTPKTGRDEGMDERRGVPANATVNPEVVKGWFPLPERFGDPALSDLSVDIERGKPLNLDLK